jgi:hypothetical protein
MDGGALVGVGSFTLKNHFGRMVKNTMSFTISKGLGYKP